ncbi:hypothetical protein BZG36_02494 [Bifiguratus adelaidae]|uniref:Phospholipid/glycerol acyltransferase domain-containing protein n=1 Tax=Bifiguratus adelaidae TaxID=1938954 RepID=A0A261Y2S2_9FUNG|nr:hypothetical protein BZG36_02494 [Bifiguratus adelaidae]
MPFGTSHEIIVEATRLCLWSFYKVVAVYGSHNVSPDEPYVIACTHHNMIVDPAILSNTFPYGRRIHYWAKDSLFANPIAKRILDDSGVVPVDRTTKNNTLLYAATYDVLALGECVGVFPEGTSHTLPGIGEFRDGTSWAALGYAKSLLDAEGEGAERRTKYQARPADVLPVAIVYQDKSKYRSKIIVQYGKPISVAPYINDFINGDQRATVKRLTRDVEAAVAAMCLNAPDWDSRHAADISRVLLFGDQSKDSVDYVPIMQSLISTFSVLVPKYEDIAYLRRILLEYRKQLNTLHLEDSHIRNYNEQKITKTSTTVYLCKQTLKALVDLSIFLPGLLAHWPLYIIAKVTERYEIFEEVRAQNKMFVGIAMVPFTYIVMFFLVWRTMFSNSYFGIIPALLTVGIFAWYHTVSIDSRYEMFKDLRGRWRLFDAVVMGRGMWTRKEKVLEAKRLRDECLRGVRKMVKDYETQPELAFILQRLKAKQNEASKKARKGFEWLS